MTFPLTTKQIVKGAAAHPFYRWAAELLGAEGVPRCNFNKYLVGADGHLVTSFSTQTEPLSPRIVEAIEAQLGKVAR